LPVGVESRRKETGLPPADRVVRQLGFVKCRQTGSHERWNRPDSRAVTIPIHGGREIGPPLFHKILRQLGLSLEAFERLR
jgi:predicted RNA binding protein YcfA (HicA-like mRNA interferase family)